MTHRQLRDIALKAIQDMIADTSVSWETTLQSLDELLSILETAKDAICEEHPDEL